MFDELLTALTTIIAWPNPLWMLGGIAFGLVIGILPGLAGSVAIALLIPISFTLEPTTAVLLLMSAYSTSGLGGMLTSILVNTPGDPGNAATVLDGYPMAKQGRGAAAIGAGTLASLLGGLFGFLVLVAMIPVAQKMVLSFSYPEFFLMAVVGLTVIAFVTGASFGKGMLAAGVGLLLSFIGLDPIVGQPRFTFGQLYLWDGLDIVPVLIGLFAGAEILSLYGRGNLIAEVVNSQDSGGNKKYPVVEAPVTLMDGMRATMRHKALLLRASLLGTVIGIIPGVGGSTASFVAYAHAKQTSKRPHEFGQGNIEAVIAVESSNDSKDGGALLPTLAFGIPGTVGMAVLLGALLMHGIPAGPGLLTEHTDVVYVLMLSLILSKLISPIFVLGSANQLVKLTTLRPGIFTPIITVAVLAGAYTVKMQFLDVLLAMAFGYVGYAMARYGFSRVALTIAIILGPSIEQTYFQMQGAFGGPGVMFSRPISIVLVVAVVGLLIAAFFQWRNSAPAEFAAVEEGEIAASSTERQYGRIFFDLLMLVFVLALLVEAFGLTDDRGAATLVIGIPVCLGLVLVALRDGFPGMSRHITTALSRVRGAGESEPMVEQGSALESTAGSPVASTVDQPGVLVTEEPQVFDERTVLKRQGMFFAWAVFFVTLGGLLGFATAIPIALFIFLKFIARESWLLSIAVTAGAWAFFYSTFGILLEGRI